VSFRRVASLEEVWSGEMIGLEVDGIPILLININDRVHAYVDECPHQRGRLSEGSLTGRTLRCPRHHWEFDVFTGQGLNPRNACLRAIRATVVDRDILVDLDDGKSNEVSVVTENTE
jgi:toluene monooxygenase system ferredoxin subunit